MSDARAEADADAQWVGSEEADEEYWADRERDEPTVCTCPVPAPGVDDHSSFLRRDGGRDECQMCHRLVVTTQPRKRTP